MRKTILFLFYSALVASLFACSSMPKVEGVAEPNKIWTKEGVWRNITALNKEKLFATKQDGFSREYYIVNVSNGQMEKVELSSEKTYKETDIVRKSNKLNIYMTYEGGHFVIYDLATEKKKYEVNPRFAGGLTWIFDEDHDFLIIAEKESKIKMVTYRASTGEKLWEFERYVPPYRYFYDEKTGVFTAIFPRGVAVFDTKQQKILKDIEADFDAVFTPRGLFGGTWNYEALTDPDGRRIYLIGGSISCVDLVEKKELWNNDELEQGAHLTQISGNRLIAFSEDEVIFIDKSTGKVLKELDTDEDMIQVFYRDNSSIIHLVDKENIYSVDLNSMELKNKYRFTKENGTSEIIQAVTDAKGDVIIFTSSQFIRFDLQQMKATAKVSLGGEYAVYSLKPEISDENNYFFIANMTQGANLISFIYSVDNQLGKVNYFRWCGYITGTGYSLDGYAIYPDKNILVVVDKDGLQALQLKK